jgi:phage-related protein
MIGTKFTFDGISSDSMGVYLSRLESGMITVPYASSKDILENHPNKSLYPFFYGIKFQPLQFDIVISSEDGMTKQKLYDLAQWLFKTEYKPFIAEHDEDKMYYVIANNKADFITNGLEQGYIPISFRCRDGFAWTTDTMQTFDLTSTPTPTTIQMTNGSNIMEYFYPEIEVELLGTDTSFELINLSDNNNNLKFDNLLYNETIYVDNQKRIIVTSEGDVVNRYSNFNKNWLRLKQGVNNIQVNGNCIIKFRQHFPVFT